MALFHRGTLLALLLALPVTLDLARDAHAVPTVWSGPNMTFEKSGFDTADTTDPLNQDRMTDNVWITRASNEGIFNIAPGHEDHYIRFTSPEGTQWATSVMPANSGKTIAAANWQQLTFTDWAPSYGGPGMALGANIITHNAVVHLLTDNIYLDLTFTFLSTGGEFTYSRSTPATIPEPALVPITLQLFAVLLGTFRRCTLTTSSDKSKFAAASVFGANSCEFAE